MYGVTYLTVLIRLRSTGTPAESFLSTLAGKLVVFLIIPLVVLFILGVSTFCFFIRRRDRKRRAARESALSLRPGIVHSAQSHNLGSYEKRNSEWSNASEPDQDEVFVSYSQALGQRMSDRWLSPTSPQRYGGSTCGSRSDEGHSTFTHDRTSPYPRGRAALPESTTISPATERSNASWTRPLRSLLGSSYTRSSRAPSRRATNLPPYTPGENGTYDSTDGTTATQGHYPLSGDEKAQIHYALGMGIDPSNMPGPSRPSMRPPSSSTPSEIMSIFGQPPTSERRGSTTTTLDFPRALVSSARPQPRVNTSFDHISPESAVSSLPANSAIPLLRAGGVGTGFSPMMGEYDWGRERGGDMRGKRDTASTRSGVSESSAARPDSDVMPFEDFIHSLNYKGSPR